MEKYDEWYEYRKFIASPKEEDHNSVLVKFSKALFFVYAVLTVFIISLFIISLF
jgi:hypothetical protein